MRTTGTLLALLLAAAPAAAQSEALRQVEELVSRGRLTQARAALQEWIDAHSPAADAPADDRAHALLLQGRLSVDAASAEEAYRSLVFSYPNSRYAADALLLLGQGLLAGGSPDRAIPYLERLVRDHPSSLHRPMAMLWLARALSQTRDFAAACATARDGVDAAAADAELLNRLRNEHQSACDNAARIAAQAAPEGQAAPPPTGEPRPAAEPAPPRAATPEPEPAAELERTADAQPAPPDPLGRYAVQSAAVRNRPNAEALARRIRQSGFDARVTLVDGSPLVRVRVGSFDDAAAAAEIARRMRSAGFEAIVVSDALAERANQL